MNQQSKILGHVILSEKRDPMRSATLNDDLNTSVVVIRRVGLKKTAAGSTKSFRMPSMTQKMPNIPHL